MSRKELIQRTITLIKDTIKSYNLWSIALFVCAIISILIAYILQTKDKGNDTASNLLKWGFSIVTTLSAGVFQGFKFQRKTKVLKLEFAESRVDDYEHLNEFDKKIVDQALQEIVK